MTENEKKVSDRIRQRKRRYHLTILILMVLLLLTLFVVQCELSKMQSDMLAEREAMLDSISTYDNLRLDSLKRYNDSLEAARADSIARYNDSLAIQQPKELSPEEKAHQDSIAKRRKEIRDSLEREKKALEDSLKQARAAVADSIARADSIRKADSIAYANRDSIPPEATIVPPEGRYYDPIQLKVKCDEYKCRNSRRLWNTTKRVTSIILQKTLQATEPHGKKSITIWQAITSAARTPIQFPSTARPFAWTLMNIRTNLTLLLKTWFPMNRQRPFAQMPESAFVNSTNGLPPARARTIYATLTDLSLIHISEPTRPY